MGQESLLGNTALNGDGFHAQLMRALIDDNAQRQVIFDRALSRSSNDDAPLSLDELADVLRTLKAAGHEINMDHLSGYAATAAGQKAFYDSLRNNLEERVAIHEQLRTLRTELTGQKGFFRALFNVRASTDPLEKATENIVSFAEYCQKNNIEFNDARELLVNGKPPKSFAGKALENLHEFRFLAASVAGGLTGLLGFNVVEYEPALENVPKFFFAALPWFAAPYISLNIFRAFGEKEYRDWKHVRSEGGMVGRFLAIMGFSATLSLITTTMMAKAGLLKPFDQTTSQNSSDEHMEAQANKDETGMINPSEYMPYIVPAALAGAVVYQFAKNIAKKNPAHPLKKVFSAAATWAGDGAITLAKGVDKAFFMYLNFIGVPATAVLMSQTMGGGFSKLAPFAGYYGTVLLNFAVSAVALAAAARSLNCRKKEFGGFARVMREAFFRSSSAMTLPVTKEALHGMGLSKDVRETVPVAGLSLNMAGVSQYLAATGMASLYLLDMEPTLGQALSVIGLSVAFSVGVPGAPASTIMLLDPVLSKVGLDNVQRAAIYKMVLPLDRIFDMFQTALNVGWDMIAAIHVDGGIKNKKKNGPEGPPDKNDKGAAVADEVTRLQPRP